MIELTIKMKNNSLSITQHTENQNRQQIGTTLYQKIHQIEANTTLCGKITGMLLQWDIQKLITLLNDKKQLIETVKLAKDALDNVPFKPHMDIISAQNLRANERIDFRNTNGKFVYCTVMQKQGSKVLVHFDNVNHFYDIEFD